MNRSNIVQEVYSKDGCHRVFIVRRPDGLFSRVSGYWLPEPDDKAASCWIDYGAIGIYDSQETALVEAKANLPWLAAETRAEADHLETDTETGAA